MPWVDRAPVEIIREHVRLTLTPFDAPPSAEAVARLCEHLGSDEMLLFSSDYPHWHFDGDDVLPEGLPEATVERLLARNPETPTAGSEATHDARNRGDARSGGGRGSASPARAGLRLPIIDSDVHPTVATLGEFRPYLERALVALLAELRRAAEASVRPGRPLSRRRHRGPPGAMPGRPTAGRPAAISTSCAASISTP